jgi:hypothetical protein
MATAIMQHEQGKVYRLGLLAGGTFSGTRKDLILNIDEGLT